MNINGLTKKDLEILKYYKVGRELSGFEGVHDNLCKLDFLDGDLELTYKGHQFIKNYDKWDKIKTFDNKMYISVKPKLS